MNDIVQIEDVKEKNNKRAAKPKMIEVLLLRGYVPEEAEVESYGQRPTRRIGSDRFEYEDVPAKLVKLKKGDIVELPEKEAAALIRADKACRPDEATDTQLIRAGLKAAPLDEAEELA